MWPKDGTNLEQKVSVKTSVVGVIRGIQTFDRPITAKPVIRHLKDLKEVIIGHVKKFKLQ